MRARLGDFVPPKLPQRAQASAPATDPVTARKASAVHQRPLPTLLEPVKEGRYGRNAKLRAPMRSAQSLMHRPQLMLFDAEPLIQEMLRPLGRSGLSDRSKDKQNGGA